MDDKRTGAVWIVAAMMVLLPVGAYVAGYFLLSTVEMASFAMFRTFPNRWVARMYEPMAIAESAITGKKYEVAWPE